MADNASERMSPATSASAAAPSPPSQKPTKVLSCILCQSRKVKCDKKQPCTNCVKARAQCVPATKAPSRPRKRRAESELIARLRKYEKYMKAHGINIDAADSDGEESDRSQADDDADGSNIKKMAHRPKAQPVPPDPNRGKLIIDPDTGKSRYIDNTVWAELTGELGDKSQLLNETTEAGIIENILGSVAASKDIYPDGGSLIMGYHSSNMDLQSQHPQPVHIFRLWQTFLDNVYPLFMIFHAPTIQQQLLKASSDLGNTSNDLHALMFTIYSCAVSSLSNEECEIMMGEAQLVLLARFHSASQQALMRANFLKSPDILTLQAYALFLVSVRSHYDPRGLWVLTGVAIRIAQRLGLHRDGLALGLSPFDVQVRRRLWWCLNIFDGRLSELSGAGVSLFYAAWDTKFPLNINDSDLNPDMKTSPVEHRGLTEMAFCLTCCEVGQFLQIRQAFTGFDGFWSKLSNPSVKLEEKDKMIDDFESLLEEKYLRFCDSSIPLHSITAMNARGVICRMKIAAHHPRQYPDKGASMPQHEKDFLFHTSLKAIEIDNYCQKSATIKRFRWHVMAHFQLDAFVYLLTELRQRPSGETVDHAWAQVEEVYINRKRILEHSKNPLFVAIGNLALKAWDGHAAAFEQQHQGQARLPVPRFIETLRARQTQTRMVTEEQSGSSLVPTMSAQPFAYAGPQLHENYTATDIGNTWQSGGHEWDQSFFPDAMSLDMNLDWSVWNNLIQGGVMPTDADPNGQVPRPMYH